MKYNTSYIDFWFMLTNKQQRKLSLMGHGPTCFLISAPLNDIKKVTSSKRLIDYFIKNVMSEYKLKEAV